jgi:membrane fusion protein, heavy metal efflux system
MEIDMKVQGRHIGIAVIAVLAMFTLAIVNPLGAAEEDHAEGEHDEGSESGGLVLTAEQQAQAGIEVRPLSYRPMTEVLVVPGELVVDAYRTSQVAPRISAQIVERHARLGEAVDEGTRLVTLASVEMADAQGELLVAELEWQRVQALSREVVSERRYVEAEVTHQRAHARLIAYGLSVEQVQALADSRDPAQATGRFDLMAPQDGTIIMDEFVIGDFVEPGRELFVITDESSLWAEASLASTEAASFDPLGDAVVVVGERRIPGRLVQQYHSLDVETRRQSVRVEVGNADDTLHPGRFVSVELAFGDPEPRLAVPNQAIVLIAGDPMVFLLHDDGFEPAPVLVGLSRGGWTAIEEGLEPDQMVVVAGAFHLKSLLLRSQLGSGHGH